MDSAPRPPHTECIAQHLLVPKSAPLTVRLPPPVLPSFVPATLDAMLPSNDTLSVNDPPRPPAVTANTMLPSTPPLVLHTADVSDTHTVACMPDCPVRPRPLYLHTSHKHNSQDIRQNIFFFSKKFLYLEKSLGFTKEWCKSVI